MYDELDIVNRKIDFNSNLVQDMSDKIRNLELEKENQKNRFEEFQLVQRIKYEELFRKFKDLSKKSTECENLEDQRQFEFHSKVDRSNKEKEEYENMQV
jgi:hypothetical protein